MRPLTIFYILVVYVLLQLTWWAILLLQLAGPRWPMIAGEGFVFITLLLFGAYRMRMAFNKERMVNRQQQNFLLSVTHELKSPLASIKLYLQTILKRDLDKEKQRSFLENSLQDIERLDDLVENMLLASKIENGSYSYPKSMFSLSDLVWSLTERLEATTQRKREIRTDIQEHVELNGDRFAIGSMVNNLLENAVKYSPAGSEIRVELHEASTGIVLRISDQGEGIPDEEKRKIFEKFYRSGDEHIRKTKGTGLGLFIVKEVADNHGAQVRVKNNKPSGCIFEIIFN
jgi:two-component system phosphate regulon sensor histidine kinase PhoR